jgi:hypothetical protein
MDSCADSGFLRFIYFREEAWCPLVTGKDRIHSCSGHGGIKNLVFQPTFPYFMDRVILEM